MPWLELEAMAMQATAVHIMWICIPKSVLAWMSGTLIEKII